MTLTTLGVSAANVANVANRRAHTEEVGVTVTPPLPPRHWYMITIGLL